MNQNQSEHLRLFNHYIQDLDKLKKDLEEIKKITDLEEKYNQANISLSGYSNKLSLASGHYNNGKLWEISGCNLSLNEYSQLVSELRNIETETFKQLNATQCAYCKKKNLVNPYVYSTSSVMGIKTVFCDNNCLVKWNEKINKSNSQSTTNNNKKREREREREREQNLSATQTTRCSFCDKEGVFGKDGYPGKLFCTVCIWKKNPEIKNISEISEAEFNQRRLNLKPDWNCPHYEAEHDNEISNDCLQWNLEQLIKHNYLPVASPVMINQAEKKICIYCYQASKEWLDLYQELSGQYFSRILPPEFPLPSDLQTNCQKLQSKSFSDLEKACEIVDQIEQWIFSHCKEIDQAWKKERESNSDKQQININKPPEDKNFNSKDSVDFSSSFSLKNSSENSPFAQSSTSDNTEQSQSNNGWIILGIVVGILLLGLFFWFLFTKFKFWQSKE